MTDSASARFSSRALSSATAAGSSSTRTARRFAGASRGSRADGGAIEADERADAAAAAAERKRDDRSDRGVLHARVAAQVGGDELLAALHHPARDAVDGRPHVGCQAAIGQDRRLARAGPTATTAQHGAGTQVAARSTMSSAISSGSSVVLTARTMSSSASRRLDAAAQRALKHAQLRREIEARHRQRDFRWRAAASIRAFRPVPTARYRATGMRA